jgi:hypothetical protein
MPQPGSAMAATPMKGGMMLSPLPLAGGRRKSKKLSKKVLKMLKKMTPKQLKKAMKGGEGEGADGVEGAPARSEGSRGGSERMSLWVCGRVVYAGLGDRSVDRLIEEARAAGLLGPAGLAAGTNGGGLRRSLNGLTVLTALHSLLELLGGHLLEHLEHLLGELLGLATTAGEGERGEHHTALHRGGRRGGARDELTALGGNDNCRRGGHLFTALQNFTQSRWCRRGARQ